jgi:hypothetical protein
MAPAGQLDALVAQAAVVRPGDTLVIRISTTATTREFDRLMAGIRGLLPGVQVLVVAADDLVVQQPEPGPEFKEAVRRAINDLQRKGLIGGR